MRDPNSDSTRLLIIDDEPDSIRILISFLRDFHGDILVARDGIDGLAKAKKGNPDVILLDIGMPGIDGIEVCRRLKSDPTTANVPVIFLTAFGFEADKLRAFEAGATDYITKPFSDREVLARIGVHSRSSARERWINRRANTLSDSAESNSAGNREEALFVRACLLIEQNVAQAASLEELARQLRTSARRLDSLFRARLGLSVFEYVFELRLTLSRQMLQRSRIQIRQIAWTVGYTNPGDFSRAFRKRYGMTPRAFRTIRAAGPVQDPERQDANGV